MENYEERGKDKTNPIVASLALIAILTAIAIGLIAFQRAMLGIGAKPSSDAPIAVADLTRYAIFNDSPAAAGVDVDDLGFHGFSPNGKFFFFSAFKEGETPSNQTYLVDLKKGTVQKVEGGSPVRGLNNNAYLELVGPNGLTLHKLETGTQKTYQVGENIFSGVLSPDQKTYAVNTLEGIKLIDLKKDTVASLSAQQYDGAYAWYSDSKQILGFQETDESLFEAGRARVLGYWNVADGSFTKLENVAIPAKTIRFVEWLKQDAVARVNTGFDDGSHDYLVNVASGAVLDVGDTSGALMGGMATDSVKGYFALINQDYSQEGRPITATIYDSNLVIIGTTKLSNSHLREGIKIIDDHRLLYIRRAIDMSRGYQVLRQELVSLDLTTGTETIITELPLTYASLSLAPDYDTWVVSAGGKFITGRLD